MYWSLYKERDLVRLGHINKFLRTLAVNTCYMAFSLSTWEPFFFRFFSLYLCYIYDLSYPANVRDLFQAPYDASFERVQWRLLFVVPVKHMYLKKVI